MSTSSPRRLTVDERRAQLLELGQRLFSERSYDELSIDDIAEAAGISKGLLYHYFGSKRGYYVATVRAAALDLRERLEPDLSLPPLDRARRGVEAYLAYVEARAGAFVALMQSGVGADPEIFDVVQQTREALCGHIALGLGLEAVSPVFRNALFGWVGAVEASSLDWLRRRDLPRDALVDLLLEMLRAAITAAVMLDPGTKLGIPLPGLDAP